MKKSCFFHRTRFWKSKPRFKFEYYLPVLATDFVDGDDVGMFELGCGSCFTDELLCFTGVELPLTGNLDRNASIKLGIVCHPDGPESTPANLVDQLEMANCLRVGLVVREGLIINQTELAAAGWTGNV